MLIQEQFKKLILQQIQIELEIQHCFLLLKKQKKLFLNFHKESIAESFNKYFTQIGPKLAKDIGTSTKSFNEYIKKHDTTQPEKVISVNELKDAFFSLKINKSTGYDDISFNVVKKCFGVLHKPLLHIFNLSLQTGIYPDKLKIARVTPLLKGGENYELRNYRPIFVLP